VDHINLTAVTVTGFIVQKRSQLALGLFSQPLFICNLDEFSRDVPKNIFDILCSLRTCLGVGQAELLCLGFPNLSAHSVFKVAFVSHKDFDAVVMNCRVNGFEPALNVDERLVIRFVED
jgi:hypothetical protein